MVLFKQVFIQSDVLEVAIDMRYQFDSEANSLNHIHELDSSVLCNSDGWLLRTRTEREIYTEYEGAKIYRRMYQKHISCHTRKPINFCCELKDLDY